MHWERGSVVSKKGISMATEKKSHKFVIAQLETCLQISYTFNTARKLWTEFLGSDIWIL